MVPKACDHAQLKFASGGFFILCAACGVRWKAETGADGRSDYARVDSHLDQQIRVKP